MRENDLFAVPPQACRPGLVPSRFPRDAAVYAATAAKSRQPRASHVRIVRPAAAFRCHPGDVLVRVLYVAGFTVHAVLRIDNKARLAALLYPLIDRGRAIAGRWSGIDIVLGRSLQAHVAHQKMHGLIFLMIRV